MNFFSEACLAPRSRYDSSCPVIKAWFSFLWIEVRNLSLNRTHGAHERFIDYWPLPQVPGSPDLSAISANLNASRPSDHSCLISLFNPTSSPWEGWLSLVQMKSFGRMPTVQTPEAFHYARQSAYWIPPSPLSKGEDCSNQFNFEAKFPFTFVSAYCFPVYASHWPLPDTAQDSVNGSSPCKTYSLRNIKPVCHVLVGSYFLSSHVQVNKPTVGVGSRHRLGVWEHQRLLFEKAAFDACFRGTPRLTTFSFLFCWLASLDRNHRRIWALISCNWHR